MTSALASGVAVMLSARTREGKRAKVGVLHADGCAAPAETLFDELACRLAEPLARLGLPQSAEGGDDRGRIPLRYDVRIEVPSTLRVETNLLRMRTRIAKRTSCSSRMGSPVAGLDDRAPRRVGCA